MKRTIILVRPYGYYGGTLVIDVLCKLLREKGIDARLLYTPHFVEKDTDLLIFWKKLLKDTLKHLIYEMFRPFFERSTTKRAIEYKKRYKETMPGLKRQIIPLIPRGAIVLYPEVFYGNFLKVKNVVRWLLYYNSYSDDPSAFGQEDLVISYRELFNDKKLNPKGLNVQVGYFDSSLYRQYNFEEREGKCYILRKGHKRDDLPESFDGPVIDFDTDEEEIVHILNTTKYCYSYDTQTFYTTIAAVCGCIPIIVMEPGKKKSDYLSEEECARLVGKAYGDSPEELQYAISTREALLQRLDYSKRNEENVNQFIHILNERFGSIQ